MVIGYQLSVKEGSCGSNRKCLRHKVLTENRRLKDFFAEKIVLKTFKK